MKITETSTPETPKKFEPVTISITFESEDEMRLFYHATNHANLTTLIFDKSASYGGCGYIRPAISDLSGHEVMRDLCKKHGVTLS